MHPVILILALYTDVTKQSSISLIFILSGRLLVAGTLDEKMYQRQVSKQGLSGAVVDAREANRAHFSTEELKVS